MPEWGYSVKGLDPDKSVKCAGRELKISPKADRGNLSHNKRDENR